MILFVKNGAAVIDDADREKVKKQQQKGKSLLTKDLNMKAAYIMQKRRLEDLFQKLGYEYSRPDRVDQLACEQLIREIRTVERNIKEIEMSRYGRTD